MTDNTITCERCGAGVPAGASNCPSCGAPVGASGFETRKVDAGWSEPEVILPAEPEPPEYEPTIKVPEPEAVPAKSAEPVAPVFTPPAYTATPPQEPKKSRVWQIVAGCVALCVICCCLAVVAGFVVYQMGVF